MHDDKLQEQQRRLESEAEEVQSTLDRANEKLARLAHAVESIKAHKQEIAER